PAMAVLVLRDAIVGSLRQNMPVVRCQGRAMLKFIKFAELPVADQDRALRFYTGKLGFRVLQDTPYKDGWRWIELALPGAETAILLTPRQGNDPTDRPCLVMAVDDVAITFEELQAKGVQFTQK